MPERQSRSRARLLWPALCLCLALAACAPHAGIQTLQPELPRLPHVDAGEWVFRHRVHFAMPSKQLDLNLDGMMRLDTTSRTIHLVGLGGLGLRLFELRITPDGISNVYLHPSLQHLPDAAEHIAWSVRRIWFDCLAVLPPYTQGTAQLHETRNTVTLEHTFANTRLVSSRAGDGAEAWTLNVSEYVDTDPWPRLMRFENTHGRYTLTICLLQAQPAQRQ